MNRWTMNTILLLSWLKWTLRSVTCYHTHLDRNITWNICSAATNEGKMARKRRPKSSIKSPEHAVVAEATAAADETYACPNCSKVFTSSYGLKYHTSKFVWMTFRSYRHAIFSRCLSPRSQVIKFVNPLRPRRNNVKAKKIPRVMAKLKARGDGRMMMRSQFPIMNVQVMRMIATRISL